MKIRFLALAILTLLPYSVWAANAAVFPVRATNVQQGTADAIGVLFASHYAKDTGQATLSPADAAVVGGESLAQAAQRLGVSEYVFLEAIGLGEKTTLVATLYLPNGNVVYSARAVALAPEEVDVVVERLSLALVRKVSVEQTRSLDTVTRVEGQERARTGSTRSIGFKAHFAAAMGLPSVQGSSGVLGLGSVMFDLRMEMKRFFFEFGAGFLVPSVNNASVSYGGVQIDLGANYFFTDTNIAPYVGLGVMPRLMIGSRTGANLAPYAQLGLTFNREGRARFFAEAKVAQNVLAVAYINGRDVLPTEVGLSVGMGW